MDWFICELRCYAYLLRGLHRVKAVNRHGLLLRHRNWDVFELLTWRGKRAGWAGETVEEGLALLKSHSRMQHELRHAIATDPVLRARYGKS